MKILHQTDKRINHILHISDIHIRLHARHEEYRDVFRRTYDMMKKYPHPDTIIVITGDILHSKTQLTPECICLFKEFLESLSHIFPVFFIAGNHDANLSNDSSLDSLSAIYDANLEDCYYLKDTDIYVYNNIGLIVHSLLDKKELDFSRLKELNTNIDLITLYHGTVNGAKTSLGYTLSSSKDKSIAELINIPDISPRIKHQAILLGDIHQCQKLSSTIPMWYAGSLIQQNFGESIDGHGVLEWDIVAGKTTFHEIKNDYMQVIIQYDEEKSELIVPPLFTAFKPKFPKFNLRIPSYLSTNDLNALLKHLHSSYSIIPGNAKNIPTTRYKAIAPEKAPEKPLLLKQAPEKVLFQKENFISYCLDDEEDKEEAMLPELIFHNTHNNAHNNGEHESIPLDVQINPQNVISKLWEKFPPVNSISQEDIEVVHQEHLQKVSTVDLSSNNRWEPLTLEFSNMFCYGDNNIINFDKNGVISVIAPNHVGKSAIIDILLYALTDQTSRSRKIEEIIRQDATEASVSLKIKCNNHIYKIVKKSKKGKTKFSNEVNFYEDDKLLNKDTTILTKQLITSIFGTYKQLTEHSFVTQNESLGILQSGVTDRKKILCELLGIDIYEQLNKEAKKSVMDMKAKITLLNDQLNTLRNQIELTNDNELNNNCDTGLEPKERKNVLITQKNELVVQYNKSMNSYNEQKGALVVLRNQVGINQSPSKEKFKIKDLQEIITKTLNDRSKLQQNTPKPLDITREQKEVSDLKKRLDEFPLFNNKLVLNCNPITEEIKAEKQRLVECLFSSKNPTPKVWEEYKSNLNRYIFIIENYNENINDLTIVNKYLEKVSTESLLRDKENNLTLLEKQKTETDNLIAQNKISIIAFDEKLKEYAYIVNKKLEKIASSITEETMEYNTQLKIIDTEIEEVNQILMVHSNTSSKLELLREQTKNTEEALNKMNILLDKLSYYQSLVHIKVIPSLIISDIVPILESKTNEVLSIIAEHTIQMKTDDSNWDITYVRDDLRLPLENASGYEMRISALAIRLALRDILVTTCMNGLIIDEGFSSADDEHRSGIPDLLNNLTQMMKFVFVVSHTSDIQSIGSHVLNISVDNGVSKVTFI